VSARRSDKPKKKPRPIILPTMLGRSGQEQESLLTGGQIKQVQDLIDLLRRNNLTELELERQGVRIRVRYEIGFKSVTASVQESLRCRNLPRIFPRQARIPL